MTPTTSIAFVIYSYCYMMENKIFMEMTKIFRKFYDL